MSTISTPHLAYSLDGLSLDLLDLTSICVEHLHRLGVYTLEQLACIALIDLASERNTVVNLIEQDLRARLWPDVVHCYALIEDGDREQPQFVIESELFHFVASVVSREERQYTCIYKWLQTEFELSIPFHKLQATNSSRQVKSISKDTSLLSVPTTVQPMPPVEQTCLPSLSRNNLPPSVAALSLMHLNLSKRIIHMLERRGIHAIGQLATQSDESLLKIRNFGVLALREVRQALLNMPQANLLEIVTAQEGQQLGAEFPILRNALPIISDLPLRLLYLSTRTANALQRAHIYTLGELLKLSKSALFDIRNMGAKGGDEIWEALQAINVAEVQQVIENLHEQGKKPDRLPLTCLGIPTLYRQLYALGIENLEHLCHYTMSDLQDYGLQSADIDSIAAMLRAYGLTLRSEDPPAVNLVLEQSFTETGVSSSEEMPALLNISVDQEVNVPSENQQSPISVEDAIENMLAKIEPRQAEVLRLRYGLNGNVVHTLAETGQQFSLTRERIRQIEQKAIKKLRHPRNQRFIKPTILRLEEALLNANGVISVQNAQEVLSAQTNEDMIISESLLAFVLLFASHIKTIKGIPVIALACKPYNKYLTYIPTIFTLLKRVVSEALAPVPLADVLARFASASNGKMVMQHVPESFILACLNAHPDIVVDDEGLYGLKQWANKRLDDIIIVLRQHGKPMHYSEIAERVNDRLPVDQQTTAHNIHANIGRLPHLFVRVGHGIFGLAEWGLKQDRSLADAAYRVLREANSALEVEQLIDRVLETWHVKRGSVRAAIDLDDRFVQVGRNMYWLANSLSSDPHSKPVTDFDTLFGDVLLRRREELEEDRTVRSQHDTLEEARRLGTSIFD